MKQIILTIRKSIPNDFDSIWEIFRPILKAEETYPFPASTTKAQAKKIWLNKKNAVYVGLLHDKIVASYYLKPNQEGLGAHIANGAYIVHPDFQGLGIGLQIGQHSLESAKELGYLGIQFNLVVSSNIASIKLWQKLGFKILGKIPHGFKHGKLGLVDAYILFYDLRTTD